jgi:transglutaminase-like putative cysteine protease
MSVEANAPVSTNVLAAARERVRIEPVPNWVLACAYAPDFRAKTAGPVTHLLIDRQVHAELHQTFVRMAVRLETMQAVQHESQWRLEFSPRSQAVALHSIKVRRGAAETEHLALDRLHFLQREAGLEGFVIDGWVTLLLLLEDVRPGDVLEWAYTIQSQSQVLPDSCAAFFSLPANTQVGTHHLWVQFAEARPLRWKSSASDLEPVETRENGVVRWQWFSTGYACPAAEESVPAWYIGYPWIQISDCADWNIIAAAFAGAWKEEPASDALAVQAREILAAETDLPGKVDRAIQLVQDEFRYLSVNLELGGQVPTDSETVIRRRYGDCKDLAFLLVQLLRQIGISARPVLVNTVLGKSVKALLPSAGAFNHAVVEFQIDGETRWVDATMKRQGGSALNRIVPDYGVGLPVEAASSELIPPPDASLQPGVFELKESLLVDTTGDPSHLSVVVNARGLYAEKLRAEFENEGLEAIAKKRLQIYTDKFVEAKRIGPLQYRDDREANQFALAEVFEVNGFLYTDDTPDCCWLNFQNDVLCGTLTRPAAGPRRTPLALPYPCRIVHTIEVESPGLEVAALPAARLRGDFFEFACTSRGVRKFTSATFSLTTLTDAVAPGRMDDYKKQVEQVMPLSSLRVRLPLGYSRVRKRGDFGVLPPLVRPVSGNPAFPPLPTFAPARMSPSPGIAIINALPDAEGIKTRTTLAEQDLTNIILLEPEEVEARRRARRARHKRRGAGPNPKRDELFWMLAFVGLAAFIIGILYLVTRGH